MSNNDHHDSGGQPVAAPKAATRTMVMILAALVVVALLAWFLLGNNRAPGPAATEASKSQTEQSFEDTTIVNPDGSVVQQTPSATDTLTPAGEAIPAPTVTPSAAAQANTTGQ